MPDRKSERGERRERERELRNDAEEECVPCPAERGQGKRKRE